MLKYYNIKAGQAASLFTVNDAKQNMARDPLMSIYKCTVNPVSINVANK